MRAPARPVGTLACAALVAFLLPAACGERRAAPPEAAPPPAGGVGLDGRLPPGTVPVDRPNVLLIVIDTLRADMLGAEEQSASAMPALTRRARGGVRYPEAFAPSSWTLPSLTSLLTARLPSEHGIEGEEGAASGLTPSATWAEVLGRGLGYETLAWVGERWPSGPGAMLEGFDVVVPQASFQAVPHLLPGWVRRRPSGRPWFLLLHTFEAHDPYGPENHPFPPRRLRRPGGPDPLADLGPLATGAALTRRFVLDAAVREALLDDPARAGLLAEHARYTWSGFAQDPDAALALELRTAYEAGVRWVDGLLESTLRQMEDAGLLNDTLAIVTGDHGEAFGEHGMLLHGRQLYDELLRVPLVLLGPWGGAPGTVVHEPVSLLDLLPTTLARLGVPAPGGLSGRPLPLAPRLAPPPRALRSQVVRRALHTGGLSDALVEGVRDGAHKLILSYDRRQRTVREEAYDLRRDPGERHDLVGPDGRADLAPCSEAFRAAAAEARARLQGLATIEVLAPEAPASAPPAPLPSRPR